MDLSRAVWRKSSHSTQNGSCVEIAAVRNSTQGAPAALAIRDSKDPAGPALAFTPAHWRAFAARVKAGELDLP